MIKAVALAMTMSLLLVSGAGCGSTDEPARARADATGTGGGVAELTEAEPEAAPAQREPEAEPEPEAAPDQRELEAEGELEAGAAPTAAVEEAVLVPDSAAAGSTRFALELLAEGFATPVTATAPPGNTTQIFVADQIGTVTALAIRGTDATTPERFTFLDVGAGGLDLIVPLPLDAGFDERGLLGLAFHPGYATNGLLYTYTSEPLGPEPDFTTMAPGDERDDEASLSVIREWRVTDPADAAGVVDPNSSRILMTIEQPQKNHNGGALAFGPDAMLYITLGDGGARDDQGAGHAPGGNAQDLSDDNLLGKILRIDPMGTNGRTGEYGIPVDNPFVGEDGPDEVFAYGFRNPFRMSFDRVTGDLYVGDVGQADIEEVDLVVSGGNYGWPVKEGTFLFDDNGPAGRGFAAENSPGAPTTMIDPIAQYDHDVGISVIGGFVYRGERLPGFVGAYIFGDFTAGDGAQGLFFALRNSVLNQIEPVNHDDTRMYITGFGEDANGELYVMGILRPETAGTSGRILQLVPAA